jgi:hypothetical protein
MVCCGGGLGVAVGTEVLLIVNRTMEDRKERESSLAVNKSNFQVVDQKGQSTPGLCEELRVVQRPQPWSARTDYATDINCHQSITYGLERSSLNELLSGRLGWGCDSQI